jgi:diaminohydroxyphosphoribosylaminopyrimidine deaminase/5-amino-6-(5-phosphoribosylamino)uracil reductase
MNNSADINFMRQALELAKKGEGYVEPNPMVGCVLVRDNQVIGSGYHTQYGAAHAETAAIRNAGTDLTGATCYVTLEPCSHYGKTPPCVQAILQTGIRRVVAAMRDPNPVVNGKGLQILRESNISVTENVLADEAKALNAPYLTLMNEHRPWVHAKWAMTLDGRLASKTNESQWISGEESRKVVHQLRSKMDAIVIGSGTAKSDDPHLTVRLDTSERRGNRTPIRVVLDSSAAISPESNLVQTAHEVPVLIVTNNAIPAERQRVLEKFGCEILCLPSKTNDKAEQCRQLLKHLAERKMTHLLLEGGSTIFGMFFDLGCIDEVHAFIAPKLIGGETAIPVIGGIGLDKMQFAAELSAPEIHILGQDVYVHGRTLFASRQ